MRSVILDSDQYENSTKILALPKITKKKYQACYDHGLLGQTVTQFICLDHV